MDNHLDVSGRKYSSGFLNHSKMTSSSAKILQLSAVKPDADLVFWRPHKLNKSFSASGYTIHSGKKVTIKVNPTDEGTGIIFTREDLKISIKLSPAVVFSRSYATSIIFNADIKISMIEHCLSALSACGISNCHIHVDGDEMPIFDGSSIEYLNLIINAGITPVKKTNIILIKKEFNFKFNKSSYIFLPANKPQLNVNIFYAHPCIGNQSMEVDISLDKYQSEIAKARTYGFLEDKHEMQKHGLGCGASLTNAIIFDKNEILNKDKFRFENECARHKCLDLLGDMFISGKQIIGRIEAYYPGHMGNVHAIKALLEAENVAINCSKEF